MIACMLVEVVYCRQPFHSLSSLEQCLTRPSSHQVRTGKTHARDRSSSSVQDTNGKCASSALPFSGLTDDHQVGFYLSITYTLAHFFIKMSILVFYARIFTLHTTWFKIGIYATMAYVTGWALSLLILIFTQWYDHTD
jgi:hypothetical protein